MTKLIGSGQVVQRSHDISGSSQKIPSLQAVMSSTTT